MKKRMNTYLVIMILSLVLSIAYNSYIFAEAETNSELINIIRKTASKGIPDPNFIMANLNEISKSGITDKNIELFIEGIEALGLMFYIDDRKINRVKEFFEKIKREINNYKDEISIAIKNSKTWIDNWKRVRDTLGIDSVEQLSDGKICTNIILSLAEYTDNPAHKLDPRTIALVYVDIALEKYYKMNDKMKPIFGRELDEDKKLHAYSMLEEILNLYPDSVLVEKYRYQILEALSQWEDINNIQKRFICRLWNDGKPVNNTHHFYNKSKVVEIDVSNINKKDLLKYWHTYSAELIYNIFLNPPENLDYNTKEKLISVLVRADTKNSKECLINILKQSTDPETIKIVAKALGKIVDPEATSTLLSLWNWYTYTKKNPELKSIIEDSLVENITNLRLSGKTSVTIQSMVNKLSNIMKDRRTEAEAFRLISDNPKEFATPKNIEEIRNIMKNSNDVLSRLNAMLTLSEVEKGTKLSNDLIEGFKHFTQDIRQGGLFWAQMEKDPEIAKLHTLIKTRLSTIELLTKKLDSIVFWRYCIRELNAEIKQKKEELKKAKEENKVSLKKELKDCQRRKKEYQELLKEIAKKINEILGPRTVSKERIVGNVEDNIFHYLRKVIIPATVTYSNEKLKPIKEQFISKQNEYIDRIVNCVKFIIQESEDRVFLNSLLDYTEACIDCSKKNEFYDYLKSDKYVENKWKKEIAPVIKDSYWQMVKKQIERMQKGAPWFLRYWRYLIFGIPVYGKDSKDSTNESPEVKPPGVYDLPSAVRNPKKFYGEFFGMKKENPICPLW